MSKTDKAKSSLAIMAAVGVAMVLIAIIFDLHNHTLVEWWKPTVVCLVLAVGLALLVTKLRRRNPSLEVIPAVALIFLGALAGFYALNYYAADTATAAVVEAPVVRKFTEQHYRTRRISRRTVGRGQPYNVYCAEIECPGGRLKKVQMSPGRYNRIRAGGTMQITCQTGWFDIGIIKD